MFGDIFVAGKNFVEPFVVDKILHIELYLGHSQQFWSI